MTEGSLLHDAIVYLAAAVVCVPVAARLGFGSVIGYLAAGAVIGPWGLGLVAHAESTMRFAEFGVVLMLFLIGLELDPKRLIQMRGPVFVGGGLQMAACGGALAAALMAAGLSWQGAVAAGIAGAMSSTAISIQSMTERNLLPAPLGRASLAILLFQDISAIAVLALVPLLGTAQPGGQPAWIQALSAVGAIAGVVVVGRFVLPPVMRLIARSEVREIFTAFALLLVIAIAEAMQIAGLSMGLGAFLAGVLLASSEYRHALEADIAPFKGLLLGLFFIAVGMSIDFGLAMDQPVRLALLVGGLVLIKGVVLASIAPAVGVGKRERWLFAWLLSQAGEFTFVVYTAARVADALPADWEALLTASAALSLATTPLLILLHDRLTVRRAQEQREADAIDGEGTEVIVAGFGRYGQIVTRLLLAHDVRVTVLDHSPEQIDLLRKFGYQVFYGDATRLDLLEAAGARKAKLLVVAIDDVADSLALVDRARAEFPSLRIVARARNVRHWLELQDRGVTAVERETFESSLRTGRAALEALGVAPFEAREFADAFRRRNLGVLRSLLPHFRDDAKAVALAKSGRQELEENLRRDREARRTDGGADGWH